MYSSAAGRVVRREAIVLPDHDRRFMRLALRLAHRARQAGEVPVGAVVIQDGQVAGEGHNQSIALTDPTAHAEVLAIRDAASRLGNYRLIGATLYCTVEPCLMCLGTMLHARVDRLVFGAPDLRIGATARLEAMHDARAGLNHRFEICGGILADEASSLLLDFFRERRGPAERDMPPVRRCGEVPKWS